VLCRDARLHEGFVFSVGQRFIFLNIVVHCAYYQVCYSCNACEKIQRNEKGQAFAHRHDCCAQVPPAAARGGNRLAVPADLHLPLQPVFAAALPRQLWRWGWDAVSVVWAVLLSAPVAVASALAATAAAARAVRLHLSRRGPVAGAAAATSRPDARRR